MVMQGFSRKARPGDPLFFLIHFFFLLQLVTCWSRQLSMSAPSIYISIDLLFSYPLILSSPLPILSSDMTLGHGDISRDVCLHAADACLSLCLSVCLLASVCGNVHHHCSIIHRSSLLDRTDHHSHSLQHFYTTHHILFYHSSPILTVLC